MLTRRQSLFFLLLFLPLAILLLAGVALYGRSEIERELTRLRSQETLSVGLGASALRGNLEAISRDLEFTASYSALRAAVDQPTPGNLVHLAADWVSFSRSQGVYDQLRWLDETGMEIVRVDYLKGQPHAVPAAKLQNKGARYFFQDTFKLDAGQIYISPLDLNVEQDQIELPHKPTLRVATPIFNSAGKRRGIVILNYDGNAMLQAFASAASNRADHLMLLNREGYWLKSPNPDDEWGFMFKRSDLTLAEHAPGAWARVQGSDRGQMALADGLWTWQTVYPLQAGQTSSTGAADVLALSRGEVDAHQYVWKSVAHLPAAALSAVAQTVWLKLSGMALVLLGLLGLGSWTLTSAWARQAAAERALRRVNAGLEQTVAERTQSLIRANEDLTRQQQALGASELQFRATFEQAAVGISHVALDGRWLRVNQKLCDIVGYTREELLALRFQDITHADDFDDNLEAVQQLLVQKIPSYSIKKRYLHKSGAIVWINLTVVLARKDSGEADYFISVIEDITARTQSEQKLIESEGRFRGLVEQSLIGIYMSDGVGVHYINPRAEEILGYETGGLTGVSLTPRITAGDRPKVMHEIRRLIEGDINVAMLDFQMRRKDDSEVTIGAQILRTNVDGRPGIIGVMQDISEKKRAADEIKRYVAQLETAFMSTVQVATTLSELRCPYTAGHERRVGEIAVAIGTELGFDAHRQEGLRVAGYLHDIGKITVPAEIMSKPGKLSEIEFQFIQGHAQSGYDVLKSVEFPWPVAVVALQHHERIDGSGYPQGLKGEAILLEARIMAVADVIEAMASHRPYRPALGVEAALAEIERGRGSAYDAPVVDACLRLFRHKGYALAQPTSTS